jgi:hypothetical protein
LAVNPDVQAKLRDEVDTVLKKHGGQLSFDAIQEMTYLDMVFSGKTMFGSLSHAFQLDILMKWTPKCTSLKYI